MIGGGFAGLNLVKYLDKDKFQVKLIDRDNFHCFPPVVLSDSVFKSCVCQHLFPIQKGIQEV